MLAKDLGKINIFEIQVQDFIGSHIELPAVNLRKWQKVKLIFTMM